jgi:hypothetical protein
MDRATSLTNPPVKLEPAREWVPTCFLLRHNAQVRSTIRYSPMHIQRAANVTYRSRISIYGNNPMQPIWTKESPVMQLDDVFAIDSAQIADELGMESLFHYGEAYNWSPEMPPPTPNIAMPLHLHYTSTDGSFNGHLASFFIFGAPRIVLRGDSYFDNFPCARIDVDHDFSVFMINPFLRATTYQVLIVSDGKILWESETKTVRGKGVSTWSSRESTFPGCSQPVGIIVKSQLKATSFFATVNAEGKMIGLDHGHPFLAQILS